MEFLYRIRTHTNDRFKAIEKKLTASELQSQASVPQAVFEKTLPDLRSAVTDARKKDVRVSPAVIEDLRSKLLATSSSTPEFWPTVSEFVSYRSLVASELPEQARKLRTEEIRTCTDSLPQPMRLKEVLSPQRAITTRGVYENCRFVLDSPEQDATLNAILKGNTSLITFRNCLIEYHGGDINLILAWDKEPFTMTLEGRGSEDPNRIIHPTLSGPAIEFENCVFNFSFQTAPPPKGQQFSTALLAQNAASVSLPVAR